MLLRSYDARLEAFSGWKPWADIIFAAFSNTLMSKVFETVSLAASDAVTLTVIIPESLSVGVPENVRVSSLKDSQVGNALPSVRVAV